MLLLSGLMLFHEPDNFACLGTDQDLLLNWSSSRNADRHSNFLRCDFFPPFHLSPPPIYSLQLQKPPKDNIDYLRSVPLFNLSIWLVRAVFWQ
jgi:hypothetical protein